MEFPTRANKLRDVENEQEPGWVIVKSSTNSEAMSQTLSILSRSAETGRRLLSKWRTSSSGAADPVPPCRQTMLVPRLPRDSGTHDTFKWPFSDIIPSRSTTRTDEAAAAPVEHEVAPPWTDENIFHLHAEATKHVRELVQELHERLEREEWHRRNLASLLSQLDYERGLSAHHSHYMDYKRRL